jgi:RHS repeat-associated protein
LGDLKVQGLDYAYTIQGWIKGVNSNTMSAVRDPGRDGDLSLAGNTHAKVATDAFGYTLGYFAGDYNPIGTFTTASKFEASTAGSDMLAARSDLWNGNISHMVTCLPKASDYAANQTITPEAFGSAYKYDQLNRLSSSRVFTNINTTTNQWQSGAGTNPSAYATDYTYDAMGNILTQKRNGGGASTTALDELTYNYHTTTDGLVSNRLYQVNDVVSAGNYTDDIDDQGTFNNTHSTIETANNYGYDELGNLVRDVQEEIASIEWTVYGKMKKITRNSGSSKADLEFGYDASGNRLWKKVTPKGSGAVILTYYYLRDAQGNEMCRYVKYTNTTIQLMYVAQEHSIYGSSRVGVDNRKDTLYKAGSYSPSWGGVGTSRRALGLKSFELANHLGNVLVTVSDKPIYKVSSGTVYFNPEITSISDYYPFGATIAGRSFSSTEYRFGFNGKEIDDEVNGDGNSYDYGARVYSARLGRWFAVDPNANLRVEWTPYNAMRCNPIMNIDPNGALDRKYEDYKTGETLGEIDDGVNETVRVTKNDFNELQSRHNKDIKNRTPELPSYNEMIERFSIGKKGYDIAQTALKYEGSLDWDFAAKKGNFGANTYKCNKFVQDVLSENGAAPPGAWPPLAGTWAKGKVAGFTSVTNGKPNLGDVVAGAYPYLDASGHVVIVTHIDLKTGYIQTMGTVHSKNIGDDGFGNDLINNGGLHDERTYTPVGIKRFTGR